MNNPVRKEDHQNAGENAGPDLPGKLCCQHVSQIRKKKKSYWTFLILVVAIKHLLAPYGGHNIKINVLLVPSWFGWTTCISVTYYYLLSIWFIYWYESVNWIGLREASSGLNVSRLNDDECNFFNIITKTYTLRFLKILYQLSSICSSYLVWIRFYVEF